MCGLPSAALAGKVCHVRIAQLREATVRAQSYVRSTKGPNGSPEGTVTCGELRRDAWKRGRRPRLGRAAAELCGGYLRHGRHQAALANQP